MENEKKKRRYIDISLPQPSSRDLRGRQSVRATFKLTQRAIEAMSAVSIHLGIKQKSLFDHLIDDINALEIIAQEVDIQKIEAPRRVQKTYVLSRKTLSCLDQAAKDFTASRDALVEYSIQRLLPVIAQEKDRHHKRKKLLKKIDEFLVSGKQILEEADTTLGVGDPVFDEFERALMVLLGSRNGISEFIEKGEMIENF
jgi:hypothetical protein